ncbi:MAG: transferrin-binding protein-like solute binding protein [Cardiobacteriaceae bacterium]|nr:transferrin-binding protein-like solute binding protein [Cardiobacteriaceae bacterium]
MKLTNLSLAIMVAVGVAACGGSDDNNSNKPADPKTPNTTPSTPNTNNDTTTNEKQIVDPTGTQVVDDKDLTKQTTVGTLQYIRRDGSQYDRDNNPSNPASASPLLGVTLNDQNPSLTNIVVARQNLVRADGTPVKAQFNGSDNPNPLNADGTLINDSQVSTGLSLQAENFKNVDVLAGLYQVGNGNTDTKHADSANNVDTKGNINRTAVAAANVYQYASVDRTTGKRVAPTAVAAVTANTVNPGQITNLTASTATKLSAIIDPVKWQAADGTAVTTGKDVDGKDIYVYRGDTTAVAPATSKSVVTLDTATTSRLGKGLVWWSAPETAFENQYTRTGGVGNESDAPASPANMTNSAAATNGLVRVGGNLSTLGQELNYNSTTGKWEDHHNTTSRIFGRYHLAYADTTSTSKGVKQVSLNSYSGAKSFVAEHEKDKPNKATQYSIGATPITLQYVQYGRVTSNLDLNAGEGKYPDGFIRSPYANKGDDSSVDNYFYRGTDATSIEQMAALPSDQVATYQGHALMYGIDNSFHGGGAARNLPNAFAGNNTTGLALGNFVEAQANFGTKRLIGKVYNEWLLDPAKAATTRDNLVQFQGQIAGNTVVGTADRTYITGDDNATFKASFFGEKAQELGGSFNSVADKDKYGSAYGTGDWGGVFGATKGSSGNTFQGDDGANNYGSL